MRRIVVTVVITAALLMAGATPASAHSVAGSGGTNYKTTLLEKPTIPGLRVRVIEAGSRFEVTYTGTETLYVLGYQDEQYLRFDRRGIYENLKSPATYINKTRDGVNPPGSANAQAEPEWSKVSSGRTARWHDHRIHHMGNVDPPQVRRAPGERHMIVDDWKIPFTAGDTTSAARGSLEWVPGPSPVPWFLVALVLFGVTVLLARAPSPFVPIALVGSGLIVIDVIHAYAIGFANAGGVGTRIGQTFASSIVAIPGWIVGIGGVWLLLRRRVDGFFALVFTGLIAAVVGGLADLNNLSKSQIAFALPSDWARPIVAASLGLGFGLAAASALAIRRLEPSQAPETEPAD